MAQIKSSPAELMAKARAITGITDIPDPDIEEPLQHLLPSLNNEAQLSESGVIAMEQRILRILCNRLRMARDYRNHPEINAQRIVRPLMLTGGGRTGSTKLHQLIAASGDFKFITFWQAHNPSLRSGDRNESPAERIREADEFIQWFDQRAPRAKMIHAYDTLACEEETHLYEQATFGFFIFAFAFVPSFMQWFSTYDFRKQIAYFEKTLKYLQWQFHDGDPRPWVLKYPAYQGCEPMLQEFFPDAVFVATHRDPVSTLTSTCSFFDAHYVAYSDASFKQILGPAMLEGQAARLQLLLDSRRDHPDIDILEIAYADLLKSTDNVVKHIYAHANIDLSDRARQAMRAWENENAQHKHGTHKYTLEEFNMTHAVAEARYRDYSELFKNYF